MKKFEYQTQETFQNVNSEISHKYESLTDPEDPNVFSVGELITRHEHGVFTNLNIGKYAAYPTWKASHDDRDFEKDFGLEKTDKFHTAQELEKEFAPLRDSDAKHRKKLADEEAAKVKKAEIDKAVEVELARLKKGEEGKTVVVP